MNLLLLLQGSQAQTRGTASFGATADLAQVIHGTRSPEDTAVLIASVPHTAPAPLLPFL